MILMTNKQFWRGILVLVIIVIVVIGGGKLYNTIEDARLQAKYGAKK